MSQCERLLKALQAGPVDPLQAWTELGIYRLAARANDLRDRGYNIETRAKIVQNRYGETCRVAEYVLHG